MMTVVASVSVTVCYICRCWQVGPHVDVGMLVQILTCSAHVPLNVAKAE